MKRWLAMLLLFAAVPLHAATLTLAQYIDALDAIRISDPTAARTKAQQLVGSNVDGPNGRFDVDGALLHDIMASPKAAQPHLVATIAALRAAAPASAPPKSDPRLLEKLRKDEEIAALQRGGEVGTAGGDPETLEKTASWFQKIADWIGRMLDKLANWFDRWWPRSRKDTKATPVVGTRWMVTLLAVAIVLVLAVLAFEVIRRSRAAKVTEPAVESDPITSKRDEDPLSRGANEWERYAAQLAAAGRVREAIRAWYHAVLVTLYAAGILHFRKGRTNWEYVAALSPDVLWRPEFVTLTRRFEEEWYGHDRSSGDALEECRDRARHILDLVRRRAAA